MPSPSARKNTPRLIGFAAIALDFCFNLLQTKKLILHAFVHAAEGTAVPRATFGNADNEAVCFAGRPEENVFTAHIVSD